jgi:hypothetical protein
VWAPARIGESMSVVKDTVWKASLSPPSLAIGRAVPYFQPLGRVMVAVTVKSSLFTPLG